MKILNIENKDLMKKYSGTYKFREQHSGTNDTYMWTGVHTYIHISIWLGGGATWWGEMRYLAAAEFSSVAAGGY